ncbi:hypothetical protein [Streptomyces canus]|nr:hypothetical protein [Streptomyces canus]
MSDTAQPVQSARRTTATSAPGNPPGRPKQRDAFFDNAKYLAIVLVAMGHA